MFRVLGVAVFEVRILLRLIPRAPLPQLVNRKVSRDRVEPCRDRFCFIAPGPVPLKAQKRFLGNIHRIFPVAHQLQRIMEEPQVIFTEDGGDLRIGFRHVPDGRGFDSSDHFAPPFSKYAIAGEVFEKKACRPLAATAEQIRRAPPRPPLLPRKVFSKYNLQVGPIVNTDLISIDQEHPDEDALLTAAAAIRRGEVVAIPTDALYTLVADPYNLHAIGKVFLAKGREIHRSLPLLITDTFMAEDLAKELSHRFYQLSRHFWPGPLTIIVPAGEKVPLKVTGNTGRLALRQVRTPVARKLVEILQQPIIATSANISGQPTCKSGIEVFGTMDGRLKLVLDGGGCMGAGSTTVDITEPYWRVIKEGVITEKQIADVLHVA